MFVWDQRAGRWISWDLNSGPWPALCAAVYLSLFRDYKGNEVLTTGLKGPSMITQAEFPAFSGLKQSSGEEAAQRTKGRPQTRVSNSKLGVRIRE